MSWRFLSPDFSLTVLDQTTLACPGNKRDRCPFQLLREVHFICIEFSHCITLEVATFCLSQPVRYSSTCSDRYRCGPALPPFIMVSQQLAPASRPLLFRTLQYLSTYCPAFYAVQCIIGFPVFLSLLNNLPFPAKPTANTSLSLHHSHPLPVLHQLPPV